MLARPRKVIESTEDSKVDVKLSTKFPVAVYDPTAMQPRIIEAYDQTQLDQLLTGGWRILNND